jgi:DNA-binding NarL/FixJ family response regulator
MSERDERILQLAAQGLTKIAIAERLGISRITVHRVLARSKQ